MECKPDRRVYVAVAVRSDLNRALAEDTVMSSELVRHRSAHYLNRALAKDIGMGLLTYSIISRWDVQQRFAAAYGDRVLEVRINREGRFEYQEYNPKTKH